MKDENSKTKNTARKDSQSWTWYKVWANTLFHPRTATGEALLSEGNISLRRAVLWLVLAALIEATFVQYILPKTPFVFSWQNTLKQLSAILLSSLYFPFGVFIFCGVIHLVAKLFGSKGTLRSFLIVYASFAAPLWIIFGLSFSLGLGMHKIGGYFLLFGTFLEFYWLIIINAITIKSVYRFPWTGTCLLTVLIIMVVFILVLVILYSFFKSASIPI